MRQLIVFLVISSLMAGCGNDNDAVKNQLNLDFEDKATGCGNFGLSKLSFSSGGTSYPSTEISVNVVADKASLTEEFHCGDQAVIVKGGRDQANGAFEIGESDLVKAKIEFRDSSKSQGFTFCEDAVIPGDPLRIWRAVSGTMNVAMKASRAAVQLKNVRFEGEGEEPIEIEELEFPETGIGHCAG